LDSTVITALTKNPFGMLHWKNVKHVLSQSLLTMK
jgi:hypothetical protein